MLTINILYFIIASVFLILSGGLLVKSLGKIARFLGISEFSAAFIIMAIATSLPELFVGIQSALSGNPALSLGNIIGANILNLTIVSGIIVLLGNEIKTDRKIGEDVYFMLIAIMLIAGLYIFGTTLSRIDGLILLAFFGVNSYRVLKKRKKYPRKIKDGKEQKKKFMYLLTFLTALIVLFISSNYVVKYASLIAWDLNISELIVGLFLLSFATTLPEIVFGISAEKLNHEEMGIGNQIGSVVVNSTLILGIVALISPITVPMLPFSISTIFMFIAAFIFFTFVITGRKLEKLEGISLIFIYVLFVIIEIFVK